LTAALLVCTPGLAHGDPNANTLAALIANVAKANQRMKDLSAEIQTAQESVNKALVDVETARDNATAAEHDLEASQQGVQEANAAIAGAQHRFNTFAAATYMNGPSGASLTATAWCRVMRRSGSNPIETLMPESGACADGYSRTVGGHRNRTLRLARTA
jgi:ABC-type transporter Mla subunit MlaD